MLSFLLFPSQPFSAPRIPPSSSLPRAILSGYFQRWMGIFSAGEKFLRLRKKAATTGRPFERLAGAGLTGRLFHLLGVHVEV
jgi:hypothetical protein